MKKLTITGVGCWVLVIGLATACSPDKFSGADETQIPSLDGKDFTMTVDQEVNQITVSYPETPGVYPIWIFNGATYSTLNNAGWANAEAGTYTVEMKLGNRNGFSQTSIKKTFTFNETKINYTNLLNRVAGKEWRIDYSEPAHMACGPYGGDGTGWWSAAPNEKKDFGVYDDRITFTAESNKGGTFTYNPGADGMTYVNTGTTKWGQEGADFDTPTQAQTATFEFKRGTWVDSEGQENAVDYLVLAPNTLFPYISSDAQYENPRFRIETLTATKMVLVYEAPDESIAWRFILTSKGEEKAFEGFDANNDFNMWKGITPVMTFYYNPDPNWGNEQTALFESLFELGNNDYNITVPSACYAQWQAQVHFHTDLNTVSSSNYDFSLILNSDKDISGVTVKLTNEADGGDFYFADDINLKAGEDYIFWKSDMPGLDLSQIKLVLDFGRVMADDAHINVRNVVLKDHANDDGTVLPEEGGDGPVTVNWVAVDSPDNLGKDFNTIGTMEFWWADGGWSQIGNPGFSYSGGVYTITATENGGSEWQAQNSIHNAAVNIEPGQLYDVRAKIEASADLGRFTFKICDEGDDDNTLVYNGGLTLVAGEQYVEFVGVKCQRKGEDSGFQTAKLFIDLGGAPVGFELRLSEIIIQKHNESAGGGALDYNDANNLWKAVDSGDAFISVTPWFADGGWSQIADPQWSHDGNTWALTIPDGMGGDQWQGQFPINTTLATAQNDKYSFSCTILANQDCNGVTIKLTETDDADGTKHDQNFYFADRHNVTANEPYVYTVHGVSLPKNDAHALSLFFDFGGSPVGTYVEISDIILIKE